MDMFSVSRQMYKSEGDMWEKEPTKRGTILYSIIVPIICVFGMCGNFLSLMILRKKELKGSIYTYLAVLAGTDFCSAILLFICGISQGAMWDKGWATYEALIGLPIGGVIEGLSVFATVAVTLDRVVYLWDPSRCVRPKYCKQKVARTIMVISFMASVLLNMPYCFIFSLADDKLVTTDFFHSRPYQAYTWITLFLFGIIPAILIALGNGFLIKSVRKTSKLRAKCQQNKVCKKKRDSNMTMVLILITLIFMISEIPSILVSRTSAVSLLFNGDLSKSNTRVLEIVRQLITLLRAINDSINFVLYYLLCPPFSKTLSKAYKKKKKICKSLQVKVYVVQKHDDKDNFNDMNSTRNKICEILSNNCEKDGDVSFYEKNLAKMNDLCGGESSDEAPTSVSPSSCSSVESSSSQDNDYVEVLDTSYSCNYNILENESNKY